MNGIIGIDYNADPSDIPGILVHEATHATQLNARPVTHICAHVEYEAFFNQALVNAQFSPNKANPPSLSDIEAAYNKQKGWISNCSGEARRGYF